MLKPTGLIQKIAIEKSNGVRQIDIALTLGITPQALNNILRGRTNISLTRLDNFCSIFNCQPGELYTWEKDEPKKEGLSKWM